MKKKSSSTYLLTMASKAQPIAPKKLSPEVASTEDVDKIIQKTIVENPDMNGSTFYNTLKAKGIKFVIDKDLIPENKNPSLTQSTVEGQNSTNECDTASNLPQMTRAGIKKEALTKTKTKFTFKETDKTPKDKSKGFYKFKVVLLAEGMGNLRDRYYYSRECLESAVPIFEGAKMFADHPSEIDEKTRPERTVRDVVGYYEKVRVEEKDGQALLVANLRVPPDEPYLWARSLMGEAVEYSKKFPNQSLIGLSINASGDADERPIQDLIEVAPKPSVVKLKDAQSQGIETVNYVSKIDSAESCDLVTAAGAGGKVLSFIERNKKMPDNKDVKHDDAAQDAELIKAMIKKHMGDEPEASDEECTMTKEAYEAFKDMGHKEEESEEKAVSALKLARHMASKKKESEEEEGKESEEKKESEEDESESEESDPSSLKAEKKESEEDESEEKKESEEEESKKKEKKKESNSKSELSSLRAEVIKLKGELAKFHESKKASDLAAYLDKKLKESGLKVETTKLFREALGKVKSKEQIDSAWKLFSEGFKSQSVGLGNFSSCVTPMKESIAVGNSNSKFSFTDCLKD